jgi:hypothetical protein
MRTMSWATPLGLAAGFIVLLAIACIPGGTDSKVDDTTGEISNEELAQMALVLADYGGAYADFQADGDNGLATLEQRAEDDFDPEGETKDLQKFGWVGNYGADFTSQDALKTREGVYTVGSDVDLFKDAEDASDYFADSESELSKIAGTTSSGLTIDELKKFGVHAGDEAVGVNIKGHVEDEDGSKVNIWASMLAFRHGRLTGSMGFATFDERTFEEALKGLALVMDQRMGSVLAAGAATSEPSAETGADGS